MKKDSKNNNDRCVCVCVCACVRACVRAGMCSGQRFHAKQSDEGYE